MKTVFRGIRITVAIALIIGFLGNLTRIGNTENQLGVFSALAFGLGLATLILWYDSKAARRDNIQPLPAKAGHKKALGVLAVVVAIPALFVVGLAIGNFASTNDQTTKQPPQKTTIVKKQPEVITADGLYLEINDIRRDNSLPQYDRNTLLDQSAALKCSDMVSGKYYAHANPTTGKAGGSYAQDVGVVYSWVSENLARGIFNDAESVVDGWMRSEAHRASILDPKFTEIGFATCIDFGQKGSILIVQHKIQP